MRVSKVYDEPFEDFLNIDQGVSLDKSCSFPCISCTLPFFSGMRLTLLHGTTLERALLLLVEYFKVMSLKHEELWCVPWND